ncbi:hypothetical protein T07_2731 [Trichinella nelsoni]|uniref:Uncharacterized protein n=1 Tax=Trichinella nelsoni TaxID=6336 RepID=A0A0V0RP81_9BILA|nr:hypothetical protein T07_2731 [Trichinella nelsoni]
MSTRAREKSKTVIICKERLNQLFEEIDQLCVGPAEVELELSLEEEERMMAEDDWSKYRKGFRERQARSLALMRSNGTDQPGRLDDQGNASRSGPEMVTAATSVHEFAARLPRSDLPKFSGDYTEFRAFWDQFDYRVHQRKDLSNAAKLTYLRGCLTGKVSDVISSLSSPNADYEVALNRLREKFDRPAKEARASATTGGESELTNDYLRRTVDALTALGKHPGKGGPREGELSAAEITIAINRDHLPTRFRSSGMRKLVRISAIDKPDRSERAKPAKPEAKRRSSPLRRRHDGATFLHTAVADQLAVRGESP